MTKVCRERGFTLWEVLVVLSLSGFLLFMLLPRFASPVLPIKKRIDQGNMVQIEGAAQAYRVDLGVYPHSLSDLLVLPEGSARWHGPYLRELPLNPWNPAWGYEIDVFGRARAVR